MDIATATAAQVKEEDIEEDKEVLAIIERAGSKDRGDNKDVFKIIKTFKE